MRYSSYFTFQVRPPCQSCWDGSDYLRPSRQHCWQQACPCLSLWDHFRSLRSDRCGCPAVNEPTPSRERSLQEGTGVCSGTRPLGRPQPLDCGELPGKANNNAEAPSSDSDVCRLGGCRASQARPAAWRRSRPPRCRSRLRWGRGGFRASHFILPRPPRGAQQ